ncbi:MAG: CAP domain-containing protein, partial [Linnemannia gamsii]
MQHSGGKYGENLAAGYKDFKTGIAAWYDEHTQYNYNGGGFSGATGHFTQVVWKGSKRIGCAKKFCPGSNWTIYICNYDPPGNVSGQFQENVSPP